MPDRPTKPESENEQRYMTLLALTAQELPATQSRGIAGDSTEAGLDLVGMNVSEFTDAQMQALYGRLDADPAALESFLQGERARLSANALGAVRDVVSTSSIAAASASGLTESRRVPGWFARIGDHIADFFTMPATRYATAFGAAAVLAAVVVLQLTGQRPAELIRESYAELNVEHADLPLTDLVLPWERAAASVGFSPAVGNSSPAAFSFAAGLLKGKRKLIALSGNAVDGVTAASLGAEDDMEKYVLLGEWNIVMWAACESKQKPAVEFWEKQLAVEAQLSKETYADPGEDAIIKQHLASVHVLLVALVRGESPARTARALSKELLLFRERFAPMDQSARTQLEQRAVVAH